MLVMIRGNWLPTSDVLAESRTARDTIKSVLKHSPAAIDVTNDVMSLSSVRIPEMDCVWKAEIDNGNNDFVTVDLAVFGDGMEFSRAMADRYPMLHGLDAGFYRAKDADSRVVLVITITKDIADQLIMHDTAIKLTAHAAVKAD